MENTETVKKSDLMGLYDKTRKYADIAYRSGLIFYIAFMAMTYTRLSVYQVSYMLQMAGTVLLIIVAVYKVFFELFRNIKKAILALLIVAFSFVCYYLCPNCNYFPITALAIVGAIGVSADQILTVGIIGNVIMIINNILISVTSADAFLQKRDFFYLGNNNFYLSQMNNFSCTDMGAHYLWIIAAFLWIRGKKLTWGEWFALAIFDCFLYSITGSNTSFLCIALALLFSLFLKIKIVYLNKKAGSADSESGLIKKIKSLFAICCKCSFLVLAVICIILSALYDNSSSFFQLLNRVSNQRFSLAYRALNEYGVHLFSPYVPSYGINSSIDGFYNFVDCSYLNILIRYGVVLLIFFVAAMTFIQIKHKKYLYGACILTVLAISCIEEHHLVELPYNFYLILLLSDIDSDEKTDYKSLLKKKNNSAFLVNIVSAVICVGFIVATVCINLPRVKAIQELNRLDGKAFDVYTLIQSNIDTEKANGQWDSAVASMSSYEYGDVLSQPSDFTSVTGSKWSDSTGNPKTHSFYSVSYDPAFETEYDVLDLMISDEVKAMVGNGSIVVEYDVVAGKVYSVWLAETSGCYSINGGRTADRSERLKDDVLVREGYYAG